MVCNCSYIGHMALLFRHERDSRRVTHSFVTARTFSAQSCSFVPMHITEEPSICLCLLVRSLAPYFFFFFFFFFFFCSFVRAHIAKDPSTHISLSSRINRGIPRGESFSTSGEDVFSVSNGGSCWVLAHAGPHRSGPDHAGAAARCCSVVVERSSWGSMLARRAGPHRSGSDRSGAAARVLQNVCVGVNVDDGRSGEEEWMMVGVGVGVGVQLCCGVCGTWCAQERVTRVLCLEQSALIQRCVSGRWLCTVVCHSPPDLRSTTVTDPVHLSPYPPRVPAAARLGAQAREGVWRGAQPAMRA